MKNIDPVQIALMIRLFGSPSGMVMPSGFLERRALRRLQARGVLIRSLGYPDCWRL
jgi:hypothetical protein